LFFLPLPPAGEDAPKGRKRSNGGNDHNSIGHGTPHSPQRSRRRKRERGWFFVALHTPLSRPLSTREERRETRYSLRREAGKSTSSFVERDK